MVKSVDKERVQVLPKQENRFGRAIWGPKEERPCYDTPLAENSQWVVIPTLGAIVSGWILLVPKERHTNCRTWCEQKDISANQLLREVASELSYSNYIWFEHGAADYGSPTSCGTDWAHIHIVANDTLNFLKFSGAAFHSCANWQRSRLDTVYNRIKKDPYLLFGTPDDCYYTCPVEAPPSQYFRRIIASLFNQANVWDYKEHPFLDNIDSTIKRFKRQSGLPHD